MAERHTRIRIGQIKNIISEKIEHNVLLNAFRIAINGSLVKHNMIDGITDEFEDESGIDTGASTNEDYDGINDLYKPTSQAVQELDYMEYASNALAQSAYVTSASPVGGGIDSNTKLLLHGNGTDGSKPHAITFVGNTQLDTAQKKFGSASCLFDGTGDYLTVPDHTDWTFGTNNFTIDMWVRFSSLPTGSKSDCFASSSDGSNRWTFYFGLDSPDSYYLDWYDSTARWCRRIIGLVLINTWYHVALVRSGSNWYMFWNGTQVGTTFVSAGAIPDSTGVLKIGEDSSQLMVGWLDEIRISKGIARWTSGFTPETSEYTTDKYTVLLLHLNGADTATTTHDASHDDESGNAHEVTYNGDAQIDTAQSKFSGASMLFAGTGDYLSIPDSDDWNFGTGDFTIDFWVRFSDVTKDYQSFFDQVASPSTDAGWRIYWKDVNNQLRLEYTTNGVWAETAVARAFAWAPSVDTWYHVALVRNGADLKAYVNGTQIGSTIDISTDSIFDSTRPLLIGYGTGTGYLYGLMDEIRISKGIARWTSDFTPPTSEYSSTATYSLQSYSEASIIQQGTYSLKAIADASAINKTLTKSGLSIDLSGVNELKIYCRASRTGTNFKIKIHDSGGTTSEKSITISSADTWEQKTWDISGIIDADKDDIDNIIIEIINDDVANTIYVDDFKTVAQTNNIILLSLSSTAENQADSARLVLFEEDVDSITLQTDLKAYVSRDGGTTWTQCILSDEGDYDTPKRILTGTVDISGQPAGTSMKYKIESLNSKSLKLHGVGELWSA